MKSSTVRLLENVSMATLVPVALGTASCKRSTDAAKHSLAAMDPRPSPRWELPDLEGRPVKSAEFTGKAVLINFSASGCGPCLVEIPSLLELPRIYGERGLVVVGVSIDQDGAAAAEPVVAKLEIKYPILIALGSLRLVTQSFWRPSRSTSLNRRISCSAWRIGASPVLIQLLRSEIDEQRAFQFF